MRNVDPATAAAVRAAAKKLADQHPGKAIELRIPPYAAVQLASDSGGPTHRRGTPPTVVEMTGETFLSLVNGQLSWQEALSTHQVSASGAHADLSQVFAHISVS